MQVYDLRGRLPDVKRDMDLIRDLLLKIEGNPEMDGTREFFFNTPEEMGISGHSIGEVAYHLKLLITAGLVDGAVTIATPMQTVRSLTWDGHEFLANIKNDNIWGKTKEHFASLPDVGIKIIAAFAEKLLMKQVGL